MGKMDPYLRQGFRGRLKRVPGMEFVGKRIGEKLDGKRYLEKERVSLIVNKLSQSVRNDGIILKLEGRRGPGGKLVCKRFVEE